MTDQHAPERTSPSKGGLSRGTNQSGVRLYNERLVLSLLRRHGDLPKAEIARATNLSPQTISIIVNGLTRDGLLLRGTPQRGRIGQPSVPYALNPDGAYSFGFKIGRRSFDLYLIDFVGKVIGRLHSVYNYPTPDSAKDFALRGIESLLKEAPPHVRERIAGLGIAAPYELWLWLEQMQAPQHEADAWRAADMRAMLAAALSWPVYFANDVTAACAAEFMFGAGERHTEFLYVYIGSFLGGGLVLDGHLFPGRTQNAGAIGSMPLMPAFAANQGRSGQLMNMASIYALEQQLLREGRSAEILWQSPQGWGDLGQALDDWIGHVADTLAFAICGAVAVIDVQTIVIDGAFPSEIRTRVVRETREALTRVDQLALTPFDLVEGTIGDAARAMGGGALPLLANLSQDREVLFKDS